MTQKAKKFVVKYVKFEELEKHFSAFVNCVFWNYKYIYDVEIYANSVQDAVKMFYLRFTDSLLIDLFELKKIDILKDKFRFLNQEYNMAEMTIKDYIEAQHKNVKEHIIQSIAKISKGE